MSRLLVLLVLVAGGVLVWGGYAVGRAHGGVHCSGIYVSPHATAMMLRGGAALPSAYGQAFDGRPVKAGCETLHGMTAPNTAAVT